MRLFQVGFALFLSIPACDDFRNAGDSAKEMKNEVCLRHMKVGATLCGTAQAVTEEVKLEFDVLLVFPLRGQVSRPEYNRAGFFGTPRTAFTTKIQLYNMVYTWK